jgi:superfamily II DNA or RNA helicase
VILRQYQEDAVAAVFAEWEKVNSVLGVAGTGSGKTNIACEIIRRRGGRTMCLLHMDELIGQAAIRLADFGLDCEIEKAELFASKSLFNRTPVVLATPQTLYGNKDARLRSFNPLDFDTLWIDEAHHYSNGAAFERVVNHFKGNPNLKVFGCTATPDRHDSIALARIFDSVAFDIEPQDLIRAGWLVGIDQRMVRVESLDLSGCGTTAGDFNQRDLGDVMEQDKPLIGVASTTLQIVGTKKTLVFAVTVKQAERYAEIFNRYKPSCATCVFGHTPKQERKDIFKKFRSGEIQILVNVGVVTEGVDVPDIEVVVNAAPTKSRARYAQRIGRGTRPLTGTVHEGLPTPQLRIEAIAASRKPFLTVLDFSGDCGRHKLISCADILGGRMSVEAKELARKRIEDKGEGRMLDELEKAEIDIKEQIEAEKRKGIKGKARYMETFVDPFDVFSRRAEKWKGYVQTRAITPKQRANLLKWGHDPDKLTPQECQKIHEKKFAMTDPQRGVLIQAGYSSEELEGIRCWEAGALITKCKENHWKRPTEPLGEPVGELPHSDENGFAD